VVTEQRWRESVVWSCERIAGRSDRPVSGCTPGLVMSKAGARSPESAFCFASNPNYVFLWFSTDVGDDPPVHLYEEGWAESKDTGLTFSRWLEQSVTEQWGVVR
jgi:hypothetical protein